MSSSMRRPGSMPISWSWALACARGRSWRRRQDCGWNVAFWSMHFCRQGYPAFLLRVILRDSHMPSPGGGSVRVEHWVVAERLGQIAAINMLGGGQGFEQAPFFWSQHYDVAINYVGYAETWDTTEIVGDMKAHDGLVKYRSEGQIVAVTSIFRDEESCGRNWIWSDRTEKWSWSPAGRAGRKTPKTPVAASPAVGKQRAQEAGPRAG